MNKFIKFSFLSFISISAYLAPAYTMDNDSSADNNPILEPFNLDQAINAIDKYYSIKSELKWSNKTREEKVYLFQEIAQLTPSITFYNKYFSEYKQRTPEALCRCAQKGLYRAFVFFTYYDSVSLGFVNFEDRTLLHLATFGGNARLVQYILYQNGIDHCINIHGKDRNGKTALKLALDQRNEKVARILLDACKCPKCVSAFNAPFVSF